MADENTGVSQDIKALQSSILVLSEKIKYLVHNEKILSRNILILNKKIAAKGEDRNTSGGMSEEQAKILLNEIKEIKTKLRTIESTVEMFSKRYAKAEELKEMKFIVDNINPLEYTTISQVKNLIKENK